MYVFCTGGPWSQALHPRDEHRPLSSFQKEGVYRRQKSSELEHWRFLDTWKDHMPWFDERHLVVRLASDASGFRWGGTLLSHDHKPLKEVGDLWEGHMLSEDILVKETVALLNTLKAFRNSLQGFRVDAWADNKPLVDSWNGQYSRSHRMLRVLKELFWLTVELRISLNVRYIPSSSNPADKPSRRLTVSERMLSPGLWEVVQAHYGGSAGHTVDLLSLDSNVQRDLSGQPLPHIAPWMTPEAVGVNIFSQRITFAPGTIFENCYAFPPLSLAGHLIRFFKEQKAMVTLVVPVRFPREYWWPSRSSLVQTPRTTRRLGRPPTPIQAWVCRIWASPLGPLCFSPRFRSVRLFQSYGA
jgi:hypothetical protein